MPNFCLGILQPPKVQPGAVVIHAQVPDPEHCQGSAQAGPVGWESPTRCAIHTGGPV